MDKLFGNKSHHEISEFILWTYLAEHIMSYIFGIIRTSELTHGGTPNKYGIESAPIESKLRWVEVIVDMTIFGVTLYHLATLTKAQLHDQPFINYWIIVDMTIMFLTLPYVNFA